MNFMLCLDDPDDSQELNIYIYIYIYIYSTKYLYIQRLKFLWDEFHWITGAVLREPDVGVWN
jgi:hypothetical protein